MLNITYNILIPNATLGYALSPPLDATDPQKAAVTYVLTGPETATFSVGLNSGIITLLTAITSANTYLLTITLTDSLGLTSTGYATVIVAPLLQPSLYGITLPVSGFVATSGGDNVTLVGINFYSVVTYTALYSNAAANTSFNATSCQFVDANDVLCYTSAVSWMSVGNHGLCLTF